MLAITETGYATDGSVAHSQSHFKLERPPRCGTHVYKPTLTDDEGTSLSNF